MKAYETDDHSSTSMHPERDRGALENPRVAAMLASAGLTAVDFQLFDRLQEHDQSVFVHGSIIANRITEKSDIDFTIIGNLEKMSPELHETLMPGILAARALHRIDYTSTSIRSQAGRKISMHISEPDFRETYPILNKPYATEYRPGIHAKAGPRKYFLSGSDRDGNIRLVNFLSESESVGNDGSTITDIPQTGILKIKDNSVYINDREKTNITADHIIRLRADGEPDTTEVSSPEEIMILGLEFDKMLSDTSMYNDPDAERAYVKQPMARSMEAIGEFTQTDPNVVTTRLFSELAKHWPKVKPNKSR